VPIDTKVRGADPAGTAPVTYQFDIDGAQALAVDRLTKITKLHECVAPGQT
jgi:hypothetical protein